MLDAYPTPCCAQEYNLDELLYSWPQGFACFAVEAMNPDIDPLTADQIKAFESRLGAPVRVIYKHL